MSQPAAPQILLSEAQIQKRVAELARDIRADCPEGLHLVAVLKGAFMFASDLVRHIPGDVSLDFIAVSSYAAGTTSSGEVRLLKDLDMPLAGRHVVIVEDIVDSGATVAYLRQMLRAREPETLRVACLLDKRSRRQVDVRIDYVGFAIPDYFVVGYGLDQGERYRNLPYVARV